MSIISVIHDLNFQDNLNSAVMAYFEKSTDVTEMDYIEHGSDNVVVIANKQLVFRFPRSTSQARRIAFEAAILQKTKGHISSVQTPEVIKVNTAPLFLVAKYIKGDHLTMEQVKALDEEQQRLIGSKIADFIYQLNQAISGLEIRRLRTESGVDALQEPWPQYFARLFHSKPLPNNELTSYIEEYYRLWLSYVPHERDNYAIHDDLHLANLLFDSGQLVGIVDFGDTNCGSIESELRWLYALGDNVLRAAIDRYQQLSGQPINYDHVRVWAIMHELSTFTDRLAKQQSTSYPFLRAQQNLRRWIPGFPL